MTVEEVLPWLKEHREELLQSIREGNYMPSPVRRKEIPKPDGGVRELGIPTVVDRNCKIFESRCFQTAAMATVRNGAPNRQSSR